MERRLWNELLTQRSRWRLVGEERDPYILLSTLACQANPEIDDAVVRKALDIRAQRFRDCFSRIPPEKVRTLRTLRSSGFRLGLISNADAMEVAPWGECSLAGLFDVELFSCEVGMVKPEHQIYELCLARLGLGADECLFVGDGGSGELVGAKEVGMTPVFISGVMSELWPERVPLRMAECVHHIETIPEILTLVSRLAPLSGLSGYLPPMTPDPGELHES